ncbi:MAG: putative DNA modification/repair radical SAM protein [Lachnospiraceae bacterium]|nr:putative DNA modification/repair radical SAM protein [Lachnospiraceae bacterium]MDE6254454.1 putative DNA modification/repair radical SAM protein [Lachnospiraceae bacterium]
MVIENQKNLMDKLKILTDAAKYDVACTSSGVDRKGDGMNMGSAASCGICHTFSADGRCVSLFKILLTNYCIYDCKYCQNRCSNDIPRAAFTPEEICTLTMEFYRRNYIEGLFLSSGIIGNPDHTMELIYNTIRLLRKKYHFNGYIHVKGIPGASKELIQSTGFLADRMSVNLELPTADGLKLLAPNKNRKNILEPIRMIQGKINENRNELAIYRNVPKFVPGGQSTQMIIGATPENDFQLVTVAEALYKNFQLKRVFYSAYVPVNEDSSLPAVDVKPPMLREHRLYQADFMLRFYGFKAGEMLSEKNPNFNIFLDPKCDWAVRHLEKFPVEVNKADYYTLLRVPGIGPISAKRIVAARKHNILDFNDIKKMGVVLKRALYFITCSGKMMYPTKLEENYITRQLVGEDKDSKKFVEGNNITYRQLSLFDVKDFSGKVGCYG